MPPERIPVPGSIHALLGRWSVHFTLMCDDLEGDTIRALALITHLSRMHHPSASMEELVMLRAFVESLLDRFEEPPLPHLVENEAAQLCYWMRPYFNSGEHM